MSSDLKRPWAIRSRSISPPEIKRRRLEAPIAVSIERPALNIRIFSWNVNGVGPLLQKPLSFSGVVEYPIRQFLKRHHWPQILCLQEVKIGPKDEVTQRRLEQAANAKHKGSEATYVVIFSLPRDKYNAIGFGGRVHGVATFIREDFQYHIQSTRRPDWDLEGRVLIHELIEGVVIINGYWVNGTTNPYRNPQTGVIEGTRHDHKLRFHQHMLQEAQSFGEKGVHPILVGDMNIARGPDDGHPNLRVSPVQHVANRFDFNTKFFTDPKGLRAVDVFRHLHGEKRKYTYHPRGYTWGESCDRVDLIMMTNPLIELEAVKGTDICDNPEDRGHSDHVPLWVELDLSILTKDQSSNAQIKQIKLSPGIVSTSNGAHGPDVSD